MKKIIILLILLCFTISCFSQRYLPIYTNHISLNIVDKKKYSLYQFEQTSNEFFFIDIGRKLCVYLDIEKRRTDTLYGGEVQYEEVKFLIQNHMSIYCDDQVFHRFSFNEENYLVINFYLFSFQKAKEFKLKDKEFMKLRFIVYNSKHYNVFYPEVEYRFLRINHFHKTPYMIVSDDFVHPYPYFYPQFQLPIYFFPGLHYEFIFDTDANYTTKRVKIKEEKLFKIPKELLDE